MVTNSVVQGKSCKVKGLQHLFRKSLLIVLVLFGSMSNAQDTAEVRIFIKRGILRAQGTISPSYLLQQKASPIYLHTDLEYYFEEKFSIRSDTYYFLSYTSDNQPFDFNHSAFSGLVYHFTSEKHFDPFIGIQPGISYASRPVLMLAVYDGNPGRSFNPLYSAVAGFNFYANKYFHLLANARYIYGTHTAEGTSPSSLQELRFSFGLGWNLRVKKYPKEVKSVGNDFK